MRPEGELWRIRAQAGLSVVAILAVDVFFHFFYILPIPTDLKVVNRLPDSALGGCAPGPAQGRGWASTSETTSAPAPPDSGGVTAAAASMEGWGSGALLFETRGTWR